MRISIQLLMPDLNTCCREDTAVDYQMQMIQLFT